VTRENHFPRLARPVRHIAVLVAGDNVDVADVMFAKLGSP
jgi:hypothetical protein